MKIVMNHIDERLIHGRVLFTWVAHYGVQKILVVDDGVAKEPFEKTIMMMGVPNDLEVLFLSVDSGLEYIRGHTDGSENAIVLFKTPRSVQRIYSLGYRMQALSVGCMMAGVGRHKLAKDVYVSDEETEIFRKVMAGGVKVTIQAVPVEPIIPMERLLW